MQVLLERRGYAAFVQDIPLADGRAGGRANLRDDGFVLPFGVDHHRGGELGLVAALERIALMQVAIGNGAHGYARRVRIEQRPAEQEADHDEHGVYREQYPKHLFSRRLHDYPLTVPFA